MSVFATRHRLRFRSWTLLDRPDLLSRGNAATRPCPSNPEKRLLNFDKYVKISRIMGEVQRFQVPYNLVEVPEMQNFLKGLSTMCRERREGEARTICIGAACCSSRELAARVARLVRRVQRVQASSTGSLAMRQSSNGADNGKSGGLDIFNWRTDKA